jgi:hypothetical protein
MTMRLLFAAGAMGLLLAFGVVAGACKNGGGSGGDALTLEEYFQQLDEAENGFREKDGPLNDQLSALDDSTVDQAPDLLEQVQEAINEFVDALEGIEPPDAAATAHQETVAGFQQLSGLFEEALPQVKDATTLEEAFAPFSTDEFMSISDSLDGTCAALQGVADDNDITVDLGC